MNTTPYLWRNLDGTVVVSRWTLLPEKPRSYVVGHRPATAEDLKIVPFLNPRHAVEPETEECIFE